MKRIAFIFSILLAMLVLVTGCTDEPKPEDRLAEYTKLWNKQDFKHMYDYLSTDAKKKITEKQFIERYEKIYDGIEAKNLKVTYKKPEDPANHDDNEKVKLQLFCFHENRSRSRTLYKQSNAH